MVARLTEMLRKRMLQRAPRYVVDGIEIIDATFNQSPIDEEVRRKLAKAIELIKRHDPLRYDVLRARMPRIIIQHLGDLQVAQFDRSLSACVLNSSVAIRWSPEPLAMAIIHEVSHAQDGESDVQGVEERAMDAEIEFAGFLPNGEALAAWAERARRVQIPLNETQRFDVASQVLKQYGVPRFLTILFAMFFRPSQPTVTTAPSDVTREQ